MSLYAVIKGDRVDGLAIADAALDTDGVCICVDDVVPQPEPGWKYENGAFVEPPPFPPPPPLPNIISKVAFRFRMTDAEYVGVINAAKTDVEVAAWVETFNMVTRIDLDSQRTVDGLNVLVSKGLLTQERATEILSTTVLEGERP
jgi:hypothetical protein